MGHSGASLGRHSNRNTRAGLTRQQVKVPVKMRLQHTKLQAMRAIETGDGMRMRVIMEVKLSEFGN